MHLLRLTVILYLLKLSAGYESSSFMHGNVKMIMKKDLSMTALKSLSWYENIV